MKDTLISLDKHNAMAAKAYHQLHSSGPKLNGIACPKCEEELFDTSPNIVLTSNPLQKNVHCVCGYVGYRVV